MKLARREKYFVSAAALCITAFLLVQLGIFPFFEARRRLQRGVRAKEDALEEIVRLRSEYYKYRKGTQDIEQMLAKRKREFTLFSFLEKSAGEVGVKDNIKYMKPSISTGSGPHKESLVEMRLEAISLEQLIDYLYRIESPDDMVGIKRMSIKENDKRSGYLDAILQVLTFQ